MAITAGELIEYLEDLDPNTEVRFATQPSYPLMHTVSSRAGVIEVDGIAYLFSGGKEDYLPGAVKEQVDW